MVYIHNGFFSDINKKICIGWSKIDEAENDIVKWIKLVSERQTVFNFLHL